MSHWTVCKLKIKNPNMDLLKKAMEILAQKLGSKVVENFVVEGYGASKKCIFAIPLNLPFGNGLGVYIENGELKICMDDHGAPISIKEAMQLLTQYYTALAITIASQQLGYTVQNVRESDEGVLLELHVPQ